MSTIDLEADTPAVSDIAVSEQQEPSGITASAAQSSYKAQHPHVAAPPPITVTDARSNHAPAPAVNGQNGHPNQSKEAGPSAAQPGATAPHPGQLDPTMRFWFPALFSFYDIIMASDDLEVRRLALASLFDLLKRHGHSFPSEFWDTVCKEILFPIFAVLRRPSASAGSGSASAGGAIANAEGGGSEAPHSASVSPAHKFANLPPVAGPSAGVSSAGSGINVLQEEMSVWLSTTMIQALRNLVDLWTHFFSELERLLPELLELLSACICQENDTLARIGTSCLQTLVEKNVDKLTPKRWEQVVDALVGLYDTTTAHALFDPALRAVAPEPGNPGIADFPQSLPFDAVSKGDPKKEPHTPSPFESPYEYSYHYQQQFPQRPPMSSTERRRAFKQIIVKCVLQLLLIETTQELLNGPQSATASNAGQGRSPGHRGPTASSPSNGQSQTAGDALSHVLPPQESPASAFYYLVPPAQLLRLTHVLEASYAFSRAFNADKDLRLALWKVGFMKQLPNLLKQESSSAATLVRVLVRMHADPRQGHRNLRKEVRKRLVPLGREVVKGYLPLDPETQVRNIGAWTPVVADIFRGLCTFEDDEIELLDEQGRIAGSQALKPGLRSESGKPLRRKSGHAFDFSTDDDDELQNPSSPEIGHEAGDGAASGLTPGKPKSYGVFSTHARTFYPLAVELLSKDPLPAEVGASLRHYFWKVGLSVGFVDLASLRAERERERERERLEEERREAIRARLEEENRIRAQAAEEARVRREQEERERERQRWEAQRLAQAQAQAERDRERQRIQEEREQIQREKAELQQQIDAERRAQARSNAGPIQQQEGGAEQATIPATPAKDDAPPLPTKAKAEPAGASSAEAGGPAEPNSQ